jgi:hypothetical protein
MSRIKSSTDTTISLQSTTFAQPEYVKSIFQSHQLQPDNLRISPVHKAQPDWVLAILVLCFILFAWGQVFYHRRIQQIFRAPFSKRFVNQLTRDGNLFRERISVALGIVYILTFSLFLYILNEQILGLTIQGISGISLYGLIAGVSICMLAAKVALVNLLGSIFKTRETTYNYLLNLLLFALITGPVLLTAMVFVVYLQSVTLIQISLVIFLAILLFRFVRGFFIGMALRKFSYLFLFVYLCSLEILPLLVLIKVLLNHVHSAGA